MAKMPNITGDAVYKLHLNTAEAEKDVNALISRLERKVSLFHSAMAQNQNVDQSKNDKANQEILLLLRQLAEQYRSQGMKTSDIERIVQRVATTVRTQYVNSGDKELRSRFESGNDPHVLALTQALNRIERTFTEIKRNPSQPIKWDAKPNYDANKNDGDILNVRVINRDTDPIPTNFVKVAERISSTLLSQLIALRKSVEMGRTSVVNAIESNGGNGGNSGAGTGGGGGVTGGGFSGAPRKTGAILGLEHAVADFMNGVMPNGTPNGRQFGGTSLTYGGLVDVIKDLRDKLQRINRDELTGQDYEAYGRLNETINNAFNELNRQLESLDRQRERALEGFQNGVSRDGLTPEETYEQDLRRINGEMESTYNTFIQRQSDFLDHIEEIPNRLNKINANLKSAQSGFGGGGGFLGLLRDLQMIGLRVPAELQQIIGYTTAAQNIFDKYLASGYRAYIAPGFRSVRQRVFNLFNGDNAARTVGNVAGNAVGTATGNVAGNAVGNAVGTAAGMAGGTLAARGLASGLARGATAAGTTGTALVPAGTTAVTTAGTTAATTASTALVPASGVVTTAEVAGMSATTAGAAGAGAGAAGAGAGAAGAGAGAAAAGLVANPLTWIIAALVGIVSWGYKWWALNREQSKKQRDFDERNQKFLHDMRLKYIEQESKLEISRIEAISEKEKTRLKNQSELNRMRMEMNSADLKTQEKLFELETLRAKMQASKGEVKLRMDNTAENFDSMWKQQIEQQNSAAQAEFVKGLVHGWGIIGHMRELTQKHPIWGRLVTGGFGNPITMWPNALTPEFLRKGDVAYDGRGRLVDDSVVESATRDAILSEESEWLTRLMQLGQQAFEEGAANIKKSIDASTKVQQAAVDQLTSMNGAITESTKRELELRIKELNAVNKRAAQDIHIMQFAGMMEAYQRGGIEGALGKGLVYNKEKDEYYYVDTNGVEHATGKTKEKSIETLNNLLSQEDTQKAMETLALNKAEREEKTRNLIITTQVAKAEAELSDAYLHHVKAVEDLKKSLREDLYKGIVSSIDQVSKWNTSNEEKMHAMQMWGLEQMQTAALKDPRYLNNQDAKLYLERQQAFDKQVMELLGSLDPKQWYSEKNTNGVMGSTQARQMNEMWELQTIKRQDALFKLEADRLQAESNLRIENINRLKDVEIAVINQRKDLAIKSMDLVFAKWKSILDPYGKNRFELQKEIITGQADYDIAKEQGDIDIRYQRRMAKEEQTFKEGQLYQKAELEAQNQEAMQKEQEKWLKKKHDLEIKLIQLEFAMRLKMIEYEVKYRAQLIKQQEEMELAGGEAYLRADHKYTKAEVARLLDKEESEVTAEDMHLSKEQEKQMGAVRRQMRNEYYDKAYSLLKESNVKVSMAGGEGEGLLVDADIDTFYKKQQEAFLKQNREQLSGWSQLVYDGLKALELDPTGASLSLEQSEAVNEWKRSMTDTFLKKVTSKGGNFNQEQIDQLKSNIDTLTAEDSPVRLAALRHKTEDIREEANTLAKQYGYESYQDINWKALKESNPQLYRQFKELSNELEEAKSEYADAVKAAGPDSAKIEASQENEYQERVSRYKEQQATAEGNAREMNNIVKALEGMEASGETSPEVAAIDRQTAIAARAADDNHRLLSELIGVTSEPITIKDENGNDIQMSFTDAMKEMKVADQEAQQAQEKLQNEQKSMVDEWLAQSNADWDQYKADQSARSEEEKNQAKIDGEKDKARRILEIDQAQRQSQLLSDFIKTETQYRSSQIQTDTAATLDILRAKDGNAWMQAIMKRNQESMFNQQTAYLAEKHRMEMESYKAGGDMTEEGMAALEARQQLERDQLQAGKQIGDAIRESLNGVGGLRSLVTEGTGGKEGLADTWERIQAAAFGHVMDPTADAITQMNKMSQLHHASLMNLLGTALPAMVVNTANMKPEMFQRALRGLTNSTTTINNYSSSGLAGD